MIRSQTSIELDVKTSKSVDDTTITVPRSSLDKIADEDTGLKLTTNQGTVTFDYRALAEIYDACDKTNIEFYLEEEDDDQYVLLIKDGSSDVIDLGRGFDYRALAEIYDACDKTNIEFYLEEEDDDQYVLLIKDGSSDVIDLGRGSVEVTFDYKLKSGEKSSDVKVYRIGNGDKTWLSTYGGSMVYGAADVYAAAPAYDYKLKSGEKSSDVKVYRIGNGDKTWLSTYGGSMVYGAADVYAAAPAYVTDMKADYSSSKKKVTFTTDALGTFLITTDTLKTGSGSTTTTPTYNAFVDVPSSRWSAPYINKLASEAIINGKGGDNYEPRLYVTRE